MKSTLLQARTSMRATQTKSKLASELAALDRAIIQCKQTFGLTMYYTMDSLGAEYEPRDPFVRELFNAAKKDISIPLNRIVQAEKEILKL